MREDYGEPGWRAWKGWPGDVAHHLSGVAFFLCGAGAGMFCTCRAVADLCGPGVYSFQAWVAVVLMPTGMVANLMMVAYIVAIWRADYRRRVGVAARLIRRRRVSA